MCLCVSVCVCGCTVLYCVCGELCGGDGEGGEGGEGRGARRVSGGYALYLCCAVLCCAVMYCAVLYCAVLYCTVLCCACTVHRQIGRFSSLVQSSRVLYSTLLYSVSCFLPLLLFHMHVPCNCTFYCKVHAPLLSTSHLPFSALEQHSFHSLLRYCTSSPSCMLLYATVCYCMLLYDLTLPAQNYFSSHIGHISLYG